MTAMPDSVDGTGRRHRVVVIGSGFGGLTATKALKRAPVDVTMIARTQHHLFQPLLYQVATGILSEGEIAPSTRRIIRNHRQRNQHQSRPPQVRCPRGDIALRVPKTDRCQASTGTELSSISWHRTLASLAKW
jgi:thioredoxin reductase